MNSWDRAKIAWATFRRLGGIELPDAGRSSDETMSNSLSAFLTQFGSINPVIDFDMLHTLKMLWLYNPDFSQYIANIVNLGNPGHSLSVDAGSDAVAEAAVNRLNESAARIYPQGCGVDGLINQLLASVAWSGAVSSEDVVNFAARRVEKVVLVPVEQIRFRYNKDTDNYDPYQRAFGILQSSFNNRSDQFGLIPLNPETYKYFALSTVENSPYARPPATAAVEPIIEGQKPLMENIQFYAKKIGLMGLTSASVTPPPRKPNEDDDTYQARATKYLKTVHTAISGFSKNGIIATFRDQKLDHTPVTTGAAGVYDVNRMSEEQVFSGMATMPGFHGRTDSTTETFADVVYFLLVAQVENMQRIVKRRQEQTYRLDLRLAGIDVDSVNLTFHKAHNRNALQAAQTEAVTQAAALERVRTGVIAPDDGAKEMGYDKWFDPSLLAAGITFTATTRQSAVPKRTINMSFDKHRQRYVHQPDRIELWTADDEETAGNVVSFVKKKALKAYN